MDGHDKTRSKKTKAEAERLHSRLRAAVISGEEFDMASGLPVSWVQQIETWWTWSQGWLALKWPKWSGNSRRSTVESLLALTPCMTRDGAPPPPDVVVAWLREHGYRPGSPKWDDCPEWLTRWSVPLSAIEETLVERSLTQATTKRDGNPASREVARRRRTTLNAVLKSAVRRRKIESNPLDRAEWTLPIRNVTVDISTVPSPSDVSEIVDYIAGLETDGARYSTFFDTIGTAGVRPSEAVGMLLPHLDLPSTGWGLAVLRGATTRPGTRYTATGEAAEDKELKQRAEDAVREVPLAPELVARILRHLERWPPIDGRVFTNAAGRAITSTNYGPVWLRARRKLWPTGHRLASTVVYDLRHAAATMMLRAGVPPAEVARRLGHSVDTLMRVYAGVFDDERDRSNGLLDQAFASKEGNLPRRSA